MEPKYPELFPVAMGNEEETMLMFGEPGARYVTYNTEPTFFVNNLEEYIPQDVKSTTEEYTERRFLQNGGLVYNGGPGGNLERATAECSTLDELAASTQASEKLLVAMVGNYVKAGHAHGHPLVARIQRRVVDAYSNGRASHDNFEVRNMEWLKHFHSGDEKPKGVEQLLLAHLATRSFMTGAGYVTPNGLRFAQKVENLVRLHYYGYANSAYSDATTRGYGGRLEIRCNDINLSPWAIRQRVGTSALFLAALQTPLVDTLAQALPAPCRNASDLEWILLFRRYNAVRMGQEGQLLPTADLIRAIDFQEHSYHVMGTLLKEFITMTPEYERVVEAGSQYAQDMRAVLSGKADLSLLTDRADNAAKFKKIGSSMVRGLQDGQNRTPSDEISQMWDLRYDLIEVSLGTGPKPRVEYGYGYKQRDRGHFQGQLGDGAVETAYYRPPQTTRAQVRGHLIGRNLVRHATWGQVTIDSNDGPLDDLDLQKVQLPEVVLNEPLQPAKIPHYVRAAFKNPPEPDESSEFVFG